jgi:hypothetical protein
MAFFETHEEGVERLLNEILAVNTKILERLMATTPVSQATFDTALSQLSQALQTLLNTGQTVATGLTNIEAALTAAQGSTTPVDFSGELATVQNLQAEITAAQASAQQLITTIPAADLPPAPAAANIEPAKS